MSLGRTKRSILLGLSLIAIPAAGCGRTGWELFGTLAEVAAYVAVEALIHARHDAHFHHRHCGHRYVFHDDRAVYEYEGRWEFYDDTSGTWYYYPDGVPVR
jgi:hypothetical protein